MGKNKDNLRKDFEVFAKGVERLEELRAELNSLNIKGHEEEASSIRSKLKNVALIPEIEQEMRILKSKISGSYKGKKSCEPCKDNIAINKRIKELEEEIKKRKKFQGKKQLSKKDLKLIRDIPKIEFQLKSLKSILEQEQEDEKRKKELLKKIDPEVNFLMDEKFDLSLNEVKAELSKRIRNRELQVQKQLQDDLEARKNNFDSQYRYLEDKFSQKYNDKIRTSLEKEIDRKFDDKLNERVKEIKKKLEIENKEKLREKEQELDLKIAKKTRELEAQRADLKAELAVDNARILKAEENRIRNSLRSEELNRLDRRGKEIKKKLERRGKEIKKKLERRGKEIKKKLENKFSKKFERNSEAEKKLRAEYKLLDEKRKTLRIKLEREFTKKFEEQKRLLKLKENKELEDLSRRHENLKALMNLEKERELKEKEKELQAEVSKKQWQELKEKLQRDFIAKKNYLTRDYHSKLDGERRKLKKHSNEEILAYRIMLDNKMHENLTEEARRLHRQHEQKRRDEERKFNEMKRRIENEKTILDRLRNKFNFELSKVREDEKSYKRELKDKLDSEKKEAIKNAINEQSRLLRKQLRSEFQQRLRLELKAKEAEFEKKKADLTLDIQKKAKQLFN